MKRTYLRYPGGKSKTTKLILPLVPEFSEYREPMVGGGSMFLAIKRLFPEKKFWINDLYYNLYCFWNVSKVDNSKLVSALLKIKSRTDENSCSDIFNFIREKINTASEFERAVGFYYLNKCSFSGLTESGTCSKQAWVQNFTESTINSLRELEFILQNVTITNYDYSKLLETPGEGIFIYLDPPYDIGKQNKLYGRNGDIHLNFDHINFFSSVLSCKHNLLISYNDSPTLRERYKDFKINEQDFRYTMRQSDSDNSGHLKSKIKSELLIRNY